MSFFKNLASDWLLPAAGAYLGYGYGGAAGAGIGAGAGRFAGGYLKDEDSESQLKNSLVAGAAGYGAGSLYDKYYGYGNNFGSMGGGNPSPSGTPGGAVGGGQGGFNFSGLAGPAAMMGLSALSNSASTNEQQKNADNIYQKQLEGWNQNAFPNQQRVDSQTASAMTGINQQSMLAKQKLSDAMAARGMGQSSGVMAGAMAEEDRARRNRMSALANNLIQFQNTPMYAPPTYQGINNTPAGTLYNDVGTGFGVMGGYGLQQGLQNNSPNYQNEYYKRLLAGLG